MKALLLALLALIALFVGFFFYASGGDSDPSAVRQNVVRAKPDYTPPSTTPDTLKVLTYNIGYGRGPGGDEDGPWSKDYIQKHLEMLSSEINALKPDLVFLQEVDFASARSHYIDEADYLFSRSDLGYLSCSNTWEKRYVPFPYWPITKHYGPVHSGQCVLSRWPMTSMTRHRLPLPASMPFWKQAFYLHRAADLIEFQIPGRTLKAWGVHLEAFDVPNRKEQARLLASWMKASAAEGPLILAGDLNTLPPEAAQRHEFEDEPDADFRDDDTLAVLREAMGTTEIPSGSQHFTFPADAPSRRLDYIFGNAAFEVVQARVLPSAGPASDHLPVFAELRFKP